MVCYFVHKNGSVYHLILRNCSIVFIKYWIIKEKSKIPTPPLVTFTEMCVFMMGLCVWATQIKNSFEGCVTKYCWLSFCFFFSSTIYHDSVTLFSTLKKYRTTEYAHSNSGWILLESANQIFEIAKKRVFNKNEEFEPEKSPKWEALSEILRVEIPNDVKTSINAKDKDDRNTSLLQNQVKVLVLCQDARTCYQLNQFLIQGAERYLFFTALKNDVTVNVIADSYKDFKQSENVRIESVNTYLKKIEPKPKEAEPEPTVNLNTTKRFLRDRIPIKKPMAQKEPEVKDADETTDVDETADLYANDEADGAELYRDSYILSMTQKSTIDGNEILDITQMENPQFEIIQEFDDLDTTNVVNTSPKPIVWIQTIKNEQFGLVSLQKVLTEIQPQYVIMYHYNVTAIRQIEVYEARQKRAPKDRLKVFTLLHSQTVEEQSYLTSLRREKEAFELLIDTKSVSFVWVFLRIFNFI